MGLGNFGDGSDDDDDEPETVEYRLKPTVVVTAQASALRDYPEDEAEALAQEEAAEEARNLEQYLKDELGFIPGVHLEFDVDEETTREDTQQKEND